MVSYPNAVAHPRAMVIHPEDAPLAQLAVVGSGGFHGLAPLAVAHLLQFRDLRRAEQERSHSEPYRAFFLYYRRCFCFSAFQRKTANCSWEYLLFLVSGRYIERISVSRSGEDCSEIADEEEDEDGGVGGEVDPEECGILSGEGSTWWQRAARQTLMQAVEIEIMISDTTTTKITASASISNNLINTAKGLRKRTMNCLQHQIARIQSKGRVCQRTFYFIVLKQLMRSLIAFAVIFFLAGTSSINTFQADTCPCLNDGACDFEEAGVRYCSCVNDYIGVNCEEAATSLAELDSPANITRDYSYFFIQFNASTLFYVEIFFCPIEFDPTLVFEVQIEFEDETGSMEQLVSSKNHTLRQKEKQCAIAKYVILPFKKKANGKFIRLIIRVKESPNPAYPTAEASSSIASQLSIKYIMYQFYKLSGESIGELMVISTLSSMLLICISFTICRRMLLRRGPRFIYQPAVVVRDISSFDEFMPSVLYPADPEAREEEKECMICLLAVENTLVRTTPCRHLFHKDCIDEWGRKSLTCPTCRDPLQRERASEV